MAVVGMLRRATMASSRAAMRLASRPLIVHHRPMAPVATIAITSTRPLLLLLLDYSIGRLPSDFSRGYARGRSNALSSGDDEAVVDEDDDDEEEDELDGDEDFDAEDFDDEMDDDADDDDDREYGRSDRD